MPATWVGLCLALLGPAVLAYASEKVIATTQGLGVALLGEAILVLLCVGVLGIVLRWERRTLTSIGIRPLGWQSVGWGIAFAAFLIWVYSPLLGRAMGFAHIPWFAEGFAKLARFPVWYPALGVVIGGTAEELLYRGYAVERLARLTGSWWLAGFLSVLAFGLAHVPMWGWSAAVTTLASGALATAFFVWRRDLLANILAHVVTDFVGIVLPLLLARK